MLVLTKEGSGGMAAYALAACVGLFVFRRVFEEIVVFAVELHMYAIGVRLPYCF